jgi:thioredoxin-related protein
MKNAVLITLSIFILMSCGTTKYVDDTGVTKGENTSEVKKAKIVESVIDNTKITWYDFETAIDLTHENKKFIFIDIYTDWCGWCKKMDATTFMDPAVIEYMNTHFYAVKMDAETKDAIAYKGNLYEYKQYNAKAGYNTLAVSLLDSKLSFPSFVVLNKNEVKKGTIIGFKNPTQLIQELKSYVE